MKGLLALLTPSEARWFAAAAVALVLGLAVFGWWYTGNVAPILRVVGFLSLLGGCFWLFHWHAGKNGY